MSGQPNPRGPLEPNRAFKRTLASGGYRMRVNRRPISALIALVFAFTLMGASYAFAQDSAAQNKPQDTGYRPGIRNVPSGQKQKLKGRIVRRDADTFSVQDTQDMETVVVLTDKTSVKSKGGFFR